MWADSILATILQVGSSPATLKLAEQCCAADVDVAEATNEVRECRVIVVAAMSPPSWSLKVVES